MDKYFDIKKRFEEKEDKENAAQMAKYMRDQFVFYGLPTPKRKAVYKDFLKEEKNRGRSTGRSWTDVTKMSTGSFNIWPVII